MMISKAICLLFLLVSFTEGFVTPISGSVETASPRLAVGNDDNNEEVPDVNVLGTALQSCCKNVRGSGVGTGFYRNGYCCTGEQDLGRHTVCCQVTVEFLEFSKSVGNDLSTPAPQYLFPGLKEGDIWCLCAQRWAQAYNAGKAPKIFLQATHERTLDYAPFETLREFAIDREEADKRLDKLNQEREKLNKLL
jgi:uncharacterized protein (DUF2237 family)